MQSKYILASIAAVALIVPVFGTPAVASGPAEVDFGRVKALFDGDVPSGLADWASARGGTVVLSDDRLDLAAIQLDDDVDSEDFLDALRGYPGVTWANYDGIARALHTPNDPLWPIQYGPRLIEADVAWDTERGDPSVVIAILDTGVDMTHPDLDGPCDPGCAQGGYDVYGHGTHVAGIAAAEMDNNYGMAGVAQTKLMSVKALSDAGTTWWSHIAVAVLDAAAAGGDILSMSLGGNCDLNGVLLCPELELAIDIAWNDHGVVLVAASGNNGLHNGVSHPAKFDHVVAVGSVGSTKFRSGFSNGGAELDVMAPGQSVESTVPLMSVMCGPQADRFCAVSGTSMSTPHVSGVAGLIWSHCPWLTNQQVVDILTSTAEDLGAPGWDNLYGHGLVRADLALGAC